MVGSGMDLELLNGLDAYGGGGGGYLMGAPSYYNQLGNMGAPFAFHPALHRPPPNHHALALQQHHAMLQHHAYMRQMGLPQGYPGQQMPYQAQPMPLNFLVPDVPGVAQRGGRVQMLGFTNGTFNATSGTSLIVRATPQRPIRGGRLFGSYSRVGTSSTGLLTLTQLIVGTDGQLLSGDPISFDVLAPTSFGVGVNMTPAVVGTVIQATVQVSAAPGSSDTIPFNMTLVGPSLG